MEIQESSLKTPPKNSKLLGAYIFPFMLYPELDLLKVRLGWVDVKYSTGVGVGQFNLGFELKQNLSTNNLIFGKAQFEGCQCMSVTQNHIVMHKS